jgi:ribosomal protein S18 acetylase RimI-like enzyme
METETDSFILFQVPPDSASSAFSFYISKTDSHVWPRTKDELSKFAEKGELIGVRRASSGEPVGLCYATFEEHSNEYEIGGLTVSPEVHGLGLGAALVRFAIAHVIAYERPCLYGRKIVAHVHEANNNGRNLTTRIGFEYVGTVTLSGSRAPESMRRNAQGDVVGDKFVFPREAVRQLLSWFENDFHESLLREATPVTVDISPADLQNLIEALRQEIADCEG